MNQTAGRICLSLALALLLCLPAKAQFYLSGTEPGWVKWNRMYTDSYQLIYPVGMDSLARVYARCLELCKEPVAGSIGYVPNQAYRKPMPVILHPFTADGNGLVTWAPRRMELNTTPDAYDPESTAWPLQLSIHESRHVAQLQFVRNPRHRLMNFLTGELWAGALAAIYCGPAFLEGDAVLAETALTSGGRGRSADFLEYIRASFDEGNMRDFWKWRYGTLYGYTPDYYRIGYLGLSAMRAYDGRYGWPFPALRSPVKAYDRFAEGLRRSWEEDNRRRAPFMEGAEVAAGRGRYFTSYSGLAWLQGRLYALRYTSDRNHEIVRFDDDGEKAIASFASFASGLRADEESGRLYWSEYMPDARWERRSFSDIRFISGDGRPHSLTRNGRYYNPAPDYDRVAVTEYPEYGGSALVILDASDGHEAERYPAPDGMQIVESCWTDGGELVFSAITSEGMGIYALGGMRCLLAPQPLKIKHLRASRGGVMFVSDLDGVDEIYELRGDGSVLRLSTTRPGAAGFCVDDGGGVLYYTALRSGGRDIRSLPLAELPAKEADFGKPHRHELAELQAEQEGGRLTDPGRDVEISAPSRYNKLFGGLHFHSWLPVYTDLDNVDALSSFSLASDAGVGATVFFQNDLGSLYGSAGVSLFNAADDFRFRGSGHLHFTYTGAYPVIEVNASANVRDSYEYCLRDTVIDGGNYLMRERAATDRPLAYATVKAYLPLNYSSGGWSRGVIPQLSYTVSNDVFTLRGRSIPVGRLNASLRAYAVMKNAPARIYPRWGIGAEAGWSGRPGLGEINRSNLFGHVYAYLPGPFRSHGIRASVLAQLHTGKGLFTESAVNTIPRGYRASDPIRDASVGWPLQTLVSLDYAFPFADVQWSFLSPWVYIRNFEFAAHCDLQYLAAQDRYATNMSVGADLTVRLGNLLWIPYDTRVGVTYDYCTGTAAPHYAGLLFSILM